MTTVTTCSNPAEAMLLKTMLEAHDIPAYVPEELTAQAAVDFAGSGIRVQVDEENLAAARKVLEEAQSEDLTEEAIEGERADEEKPAR
jgi:hypothetical protein